MNKQIAKLRQRLGDIGALCADEAARRQDVEQGIYTVQSGLDWLVEHAKLGDLSWSDLQEIKDNIKILEAKCNGNR